MSRASIVSVIVDPFFLPWLDCIAPVWQVWVPLSVFFPFGLWIAAKITNKYSDERARGGTTAQPIHKCNATKSLDRQSIICELINTQKDNIVWHDVIAHGTSVIAQISYSLFVGFWHHSLCSIQHNARYPCDSQLLQQLYYVSVAHSPSLCVLTTKRSVILIHPNRIYTLNHNEHERAMPTTVYIRF